jgi:hypothetical protein
VPGDLSLGHYVRTLQATVAAGVTAAAPAAQSWDVGPATLRRLEITVPNGHNGLTGIAFVVGGSRVVPFDADEWLVGNGQTFVFSPDLQLAGGVISVVQFNLGDFPHSHLLLAHLESLVAADDEPVLIAPSEIPLPPLDLGLLAGPDDDDEDDDEDQAEDEVDEPSGAAA